MLQVLATNVTDLVGFNDVTAAWLDGCGVCEIEKFRCETSCDVPITFPPLPLRKERI
jgi:hypothetical protein